MQIKYNQNVVESWRYTKLLKLAFLLMVELAFLVICNATDSPDMVSSDMHLK